MNRKCPAGADGGDDEAGDGGADHARGVERGRVQRDRIRQIGIADQLGDEGLPHRGIERCRAAEQEREGIDVPELHQPGDGENAEDECKRAHRRLSRHQQLALVEMIGGKAGPRHQ
ncbi:hypothetical protein ACVII1_005580 [Bradyrhizobium elkanii]